MVNPNQQVDLTPGANPVALGGPGIHFHAPSGVSANTYNNPSDPLASMPGPVKAGTVAVKINGTQGSQVRFCNPA